MRLAFVSVSDQIGGSEVMLLQIAAELRRSRPSWDLHLVLPGTGPLADRAAAEGMHVVPVPMPPSLARLGEWGLARRTRASVGMRLARAALDLRPYERRLRAVISTIRPAVVHTNGFKAHVVGARVGHAGRGLVWHMHEYLAARPLTRALIRRYADRCSVIVANSASVAADVGTIVGSRAPITVIYNAIDLERYSPAGPVADLDALSGLPAAPDGAVRIGLVATFSRWKGHETFLRALAALPAAARVRGYIVGGAVYDTHGSQHSLEELRAMTSGFGLDGRVGFTGVVHPADPVMRALDVVVHASTTPEPFGLVIAEAMGCGRAVITSGSGGAGELVRAEENALAHHPGDWRDLARQMERLAMNAPLRLRLGRAAREHAERRFDARRLAGEFAATYEAAADGPRVALR